MSCLFYDTYTGYLALDGCPLNTLILRSGACSEVVRKLFGSTKEVRYIASFATRPLSRVCCRQFSAADITITLQLHEHEVVFRHLACKIIIYTLWPF